MSHTKKYFVSTVVDGVYKSALVSSGNSKNAVKKFLIHTDPEMVHNDIKKIVDTADYKEYEADDYIISVQRINLYEDYTPFPIVCMRDSQSTDKEDEKYDRGDQVSFKVEE